MIRPITVGLILFTLLACSSQQTIYRPSKEALAKIKFDLYEINDEGLEGPAGGKRAVHYEFCIPNTPDLLREVQKIDPTLQSQPGSTGRIGCMRGREILCLGNTHQKDWKQKLYQLAERPYIKSIQQAFFE